MSKIRGRDRRELIEYHSEEYYAKCEELELFKQEMREIVRTGGRGIPKTKGLTNNPWTQTF